MLSRFFTRASEKGARTNLLNKAETAVKNAVTEAFDHTPAGYRNPQTPAPMALTKDQLNEAYAAADLNTSRAWKHS